MTDNRRNTIHPVAVPRSHRCRKAMIKPREPVPTANLLNPGHAKTVKILASDPSLRAEYATRDATGDHFEHVTCWLDEDGVLVQPHPTDPKRGPIPAPTDVRFAIKPAATDTE